VNQKIFIGVVLASAASFCLIFFTGTENFNLPIQSLTVSERFFLGVGFFLSLPSLPFAFIIDRFFHPQWAAIYTWLCGSLLSAAFWSFIIQQIIVRIHGTKEA